MGLGRPDDAEAMLGPLPEFPLKGSDLLAAGVAPGPAMGALMRDLRTAWRESGYTAAGEDLLRLHVPDNSRRP